MLLGMGLFGSAPASFVADDAFDASAMADDSTKAAAATSAVVASRIEGAFGVVPACGLVSVPRVCDSFFWGGLAPLGFCLSLPVAFDPAFLLLIGLSPLAAGCFAFLEGSGPRRSLLPMSGFAFLIAATWTAFEGFCSARRSAATGAFQDFDATCSAAEASFPFPISSTICNFAPDVRAPRNLGAADDASAVAVLVRAPSAARWASSPPHFTLELLDRHRWLYG